LLCKFRAQITFDSDSTRALKLRGPEARTLTLMVTQEEEWQLYAPEERSSEISEIPSMWAEDSLPGLAQNMPPVVVELKPGATVSQK
jgi:hypothetical protein